MGFELTAISGGSFVGRDQEIKEIVREWKDHKSTIGFALYGRRRVGKTSLLLKSLKNIEKDKKIVPIYFSVMNLPEFSAEVFVKELYIKILEAYESHFNLAHKIRDILTLPLKFIRDAVKDVELKIDLFAEIDFILKLHKQKEDLGVLIDKAFTLSEVLSIQTKTKCVLVIDEFPEIMNLKYKNKKVGEAVIGKIRTLREGYKNTSLNISGSIMKTMKLVCLEDTSPFYAQFMTREISPLSEANTKKLLKKYLKKIDAEALNEIYRLTKGLPFYTQYLGRLLYRYKDIKKTDVIAVYKDFKKQEGVVLFRPMFESLPNQERKIVIAMASGETNMSAIARKAKVQLNTIGRFMSYLEDKAIIVRLRKGEYELSDFIFNEWIADKFVIE